MRSWPGCRVDWSVAAVSLLVAGCGGPAGPGAPFPPRTPPPPLVAPSPPVVPTRPVVPDPGIRPVRAGDALEVLRDWDRRRAAAYAAGDAGRLRSLYVPGSTTGAADVALLRRYARRGLRVRSLTMQLLAVEVLDRRRDRYLLRVTDRVAAAVAVGRGGRAELPRGQAGTHVVELRRGPSPAGWRVAGVGLGERPLIRSARRRAGR